MRQMVAAALVAGLATAVPGAPVLAAPAAVAGDAVKGATLFKSRCSVCHSVEAAKPKVTAPTLVGLIGRKAGSLPQARYSAAIKASAVVWTPETLDKFLTSPRDVINGTFMVVNIANPEDRANIIAYLATLKGKPVK
jgi:cytochrome c